MARDPSSSTRTGSTEPDARSRGALDVFARRVRDRPTLRRLDAATAEAFDAFGAAGVDALLLKGPALAQALYTAREHRGYQDVDLLVSPRALPAAREALADLGYLNIRERLGIDEVAGGLDSETWARVGDGPTAGLMIDLHWRLPGSQAPPELAWDALARRRAWSHLRRRRVPSLNHEALALHLATHAAQHGLRYSKPIEDLTRGLQRWSLEVWRAAEQVAHEVQATEAFAAGLRLVPPGAALARDLGLPRTDEVEWAIANRDERPRGTFHLQAFAEAQTLPERASVLRRSLLPRREWIASQYRWARRSGVRLIVAYGLHLVRTPVWAARAWRFRRRSSAGPASR